MRILENLLSDDNQEFGEENSKFRWICTQSPYDLKEINLETMEKTYHRISLPTLHSRCRTCTCSLPGNKLFCYRGPTRWDDYDGIAFIIDNNHNVEVLPSKILTTGYSATFYCNFVYMVGSIFIFRYDLNKRRWQRLNKHSIYPIYSSCISFNSMILFSWVDDTNISILDLSTFSFNKWYECEKNASKMLCKSENTVYLIDFSGLILQSEENNIWEWNIVGKCEFLFIENLLNKVFYKNSWYFRNDYALMEFNLDSKVVSKTNVRVLYSTLFLTFLQVLIEIFS